MAINEILRFPIKRGEENKKVSFWNHTLIWPSRAPPPQKNISPLILEDFTFKTEKDFPLLFSRDFHFLAASSLYDDYFPKKTPPHKQQNSRKGEGFLRTVTTINFAHEKEEEGEKRRKLSTLDSAYIYILYIRTTTPFPFLKSGRNFFFFQEGETGACATHRPFKSERRGGPSDKHLIPHLSQPTCLNYLFFLALSSSFHRGAITKRKGEEVGRLPHPKARERKQKLHRKL